MTTSDKNRMVVLQFFGNEVYFREIRRDRLLEVARDQERTLDHREKDLFLLSKPVDISDTSQVDYEIPMAVDEDDWQQLLEQFEEEEKE